ncbi:MAG: ATP-binding protein [Candidatus Cloacimonetes bacterium]|nr:ATP-binding protein [Candidatus Cloacimonadota bacterium]MDD4157380.1 ATP-binding protein [Candidatus Cloacimonadota bacterium]
MKNNNSIHLKADKETFQDFIDFLEEKLSELCPEDFNIMKFLIVSEEIIVNICNYAYEDINVKDNYLEINVEIENNTLKVIFIDEGKPFNPIQYDVDNRGLPIDEKQIGGLGLILIKEFVDNVRYEYKDNKNILIIEKELGNVKL